MHACKHPPPLLIILHQHQSPSPAPTNTSSHPACAAPPPLPLTPRLRTTLHACRQPHLEDVDSIMQVGAVIHQVSTQAGKPGSRLLTNADHLGIYRGNTQIGAPGHFGGQGKPPRLNSLAEGQFWGFSAQRITVAHNRSEPTLSHWKYSFQVALQRLHWASS